MPLSILQRPDLELPAISVVSAAGEAEAPAPAVARLAATMRSEGASSISSAEIADIIDSTGSWMFSAAQAHYTTTGIFALQRKLTDIIPLLRAMVFSPDFPRAELEVVAARLSSKLAISEATVGYQADMAMNRLIFGSGHPLARVSTPEEVQAVTTGGLHSFHSACTLPSSTALFAVGNITPDIISAIDSTFGSLPADTVPAPLNIVPMQFAAPGTRVNVEVPKATQCAVKIALPGLPRKHEHYLALRLAVMALGGYFGSRLSQNIREDKGMTYGISAGLLGYLEGGVVQIGSKCSANHVDNLIDEVRKEIAGLSTNPLSPDELLRLKQAEIVALTDIVDSPYSTFDFLKTIHTGHLGNDYFARRCEAVNAITSEQIAGLAAEYLNPDSAVCTVAG